MQKFPENHQAVEVGKVYELNPSEEAATISLNKGMAVIAFRMPQGSTNSVPISLAILDKNSRSNRLYHIIDAFNRIKHYSNNIECKVFINQSDPYIDEIIKFINDNKEDLELRKDVDKSICIYPTVQPTTKQIVGVDKTTGNLASASLIPQNEKSNRFWFLPAALSLLFPKEKEEAEKTLVSGANNSEKNNSQRKVY